MRSIFVQFVWVLSITYKTLHSKNHASEDSGILAAYHGPEAACTGLVCNVRNFSCIVAPCQPALGQFPFENLPRDLCGYGLSVSSTRVLLPTLFVWLTVSTSLHWNFFTTIHVAKCFRNCRKIFSRETMLHNEHACVRACGEHILRITELLRALGSQPNKTETGTQWNCAA